MNALAIRPSSSITLRGFFKPVSVPKSTLNRILLGDSLYIMKEMPSNSVDLVVTSPPYNLRNSSGNGMTDTRTSKWNAAALKHDGYAGYDDNMPHDLYVEWQSSAYMVQCPKRYG